jgi:hypothetical protein
MEGGRFYLGVNRGNLMFVQGSMAKHVLMLGMAVRKREGGCFESVAYHSASSDTMSLSVEWRPEHSEQGTQSS